MTIAATLVGRGSAAGTSWTTSSGTTAASGSTFVLAISYDAGMTGNTPTDSKGNAYTRIGTTLTTGNGDKVELWKCENGTGGSGHTASQTYIGNAFGVGHLIEITGATSSPTDVTTQGNDSSTPFTITSPTLNQANEVVITICAANQFVSGTNTYSSSNTTIISQESDGANFWTSAVSTLVVSSTTAVTPSFTVTQGSAAGLIIASFKAAGSAAAISYVDESNRARPGRGPFSKGHFFVSDSSAYSTVASGAISASASITLGQSGALTGSGSVAATSGITFAQTGVVKGAGALSSTSGVTFGQTGSLAGAGALSASNGLVLGQSALASGAGSLAGSNGLVFGQSGALVGSGVLAGSSSLVFGQAGTLVQPGLNGTATLVFDQTGVISGAGALAASATLVFSQTGALAGTGVLAGSGTLVFGALGTATLPGALGGQADLAFSASGTLVGLGALVGQADLAFSGNLLSPAITQGISDGAFRHKRKRRKPIPFETPVAEEFIPPRVPQIAPPTRVIEQTRSLQTLAHSYGVTREVIDRQITDEIAQLLSAQQEQDDLEALKVILKALED